MSGVTLRDMEIEVRVMNGGDISISNDLGNIIELNDINDSLGLNMLTNMSVSGNNNNNNSNNNSNNNQGGGIGLSEVQISGLEPVTLNMNESFPPFEAEVRQDTNVFSNAQTSSSTSSYSLEQPQSRVNPEADKKEKMEYLNKLQRLEQKGFPVSRRYTMDNNLDEVRDEYNRLLDARNLEASLRFQRQALMGIVTGLEWANGKFDPFDLKLDGWSESVHENVDDFDEIFEELYDKYKERGKMPPEARLMMTLAGSGFMCHVSNTFLRSRMPNVDDVLRNNPDIARQVASAAASSAGSGFGNFMNMAMNSGRNPGAQQQQQQMFNAPPNAPQSVAASEPPSNNNGRREMRGPSGVDDILKTFEEARRNDMYMMPESASSVSQPAVAAAIEIQSLHSEEGMSQADSTRTGRGGGRRKRAAVGNSINLNV
jgi:hypothetical protein